MSEITDIDAFPQNDPRVGYVGAQGPPPPFRPVLGRIFVTVIGCGMGGSGGLEEGRPPLIVIPDVSSVPLGCGQSAFPQPGERRGAMYFATGEGLCNLNRERGGGLFDLNREFDWGEGCLIAFPGPLGAFPMSWGLGYWGPECADTLTDRGRCVTQPDRTALLCPPLAGEPVVGTP